jgi:hypothetical protein
LAGGVEDYLIISFGNIKMIKPNAILTQ